MAKYKRVKGIRKRVFYKEEGLCRACGYQHEDVNSPLYEVDHIVPLSARGQNDEDNLQVLCKSCHSSKTVVNRQQWYERKYRKHVRKYPFNREWMEAIQQQNQ